MPLVIPQNLPSTPSGVAPWLRADGSSMVYTDGVHLIPHRVEQVVRYLKSAPAPAPMAKEQTSLLF